MMREATVADLMTSPVITLFEEQTVPLASDLMKLKKIRHIPVVDDGDLLVGIVTHRDLLRAQVSYVSYLENGKTEHGGIDLNLRVQDIMTKGVWSVRADAKAYEAGQMLLDHQFSCLPVVDDDRRVVGILTDRDFLKLALEQMQP